MWCSVFFGVWVAVFNSSAPLSGVLPSTCANCVSVTTLVGIRLRMAIFSGRMS